jgi:4a-hydroxytetrahydrobiopterin dehydratase
MPQRLNDRQLDEDLKHLADGWTLDGGQLVHEGVHNDFAAALARLNTVAGLAEAANHHPDLELHGWNRLRIRLTTHSEGGLTELDFDLAAQIDRLGA